MGPNFDQALKGTQNMMHPELSRLVANDRRNEQHKLAAERSLIRRIKQAAGKR